MCGRLLLHGRSSMCGKVFMDERLFLHERSSMYGKLLMCVRLQEGVLKGVLKGAGPESN